MILYTRFSKSTFHRQGFISISDILNTTRYVFNQCLKVRNGSPFGTWIAYYEGCPFAFKMTVKSYDTSTGFQAVQVLTCEHIEVSTIGEYQYKENVHLHNPAKEAETKKRQQRTEKKKEENNNVCTDEQRALIFGPSKYDNIVVDTVQEEQNAEEPIILPSTDTPSEEKEESTNLPSNVKLTSYIGVPSVLVNNDNKTSLYLSEEEKNLAAQNVRSAWIKMKRTDASRSK